MCADPKQKVAVAMAEVSLDALSAKKSINGEVWLAMDGVVYEVSRSWIERHPGGAQTILSCAGKDATAYIRAMHSPQTVNLIKRMMKPVGSLEMDEKKEALLGKTEQRNRAIERDFKKLHDHVLEQGWFNESISCYLFDAIRVFSLLGFALWFLLRAGPSEDGSSLLSQKGSIIIGSIMLGLYLQNIAFFGHDAGHNSILGDIKKDFWLGIFIGNACSGIGISWWKSTHNCHHVNTNYLENDPDIQHVPFFCFDIAMADDWWSNYHGRLLSLGPLGRFFVRYQHLYFYPVMAVARINLYIQTILHLVVMNPFMTRQVSDEKSWKPMIRPTAWFSEVATLSFFYLWMGALIYSLGPVDGALCLLISHGTAGILHVQILLSHVVMDFCVEKPLNANQDKIEFYEWQALSTMDIACPWWIDWFHGGLQFQLEHHLFPRVHRKNLPKLIPLVDEIFGKHDIPAVRLGFWEGNALLLDHMSKVGKYVADKWSATTEAPSPTGKEAAVDATEKDSPKYIKIQESWYDITKFVDHHPGGAIINDFVGRDATEIFLSFHVQHERILKRVRKLDQAPTDHIVKNQKIHESDLAFSKDFQSMILKMKAEGLFVPSKPMMVGKMLLSAAFFVSGWYYVFQSTQQSRLHGDASMIQWKMLTGAAVLVALFFQQCGFLLHDFMHNNWFHNRKIDQVFGRFFGAFCVGLSGLWWRDEHWIHHVFTNTYEDGKAIKDIQIAEDAWAQNVDLLQFFDGSIPDTTWVRLMDGLPLCVSEKIIQYQAYLWLPLTVVLGRMNIIAASFVKYPNTGERMLQIAHVVWFAAMLYAAFPTWQTAVIFHFMVSIGQGVLHVQLLVSHYVKPWHDLKEMQVSSSWYKKQVLSTVNIAPFFSTRWLRSFESELLDTWDDYYAPMIDDWFHGGLNLHIEHHTMPTLPRNSLRECRRRIQTLCRKHQLKYDERHFFEAVWDTLVQLNDVGKQAHFTTAKKVKSL